MSVPDCVWTGHVEDPARPGTCRLCGRVARPDVTVAYPTRQGEPRSVTFIERDEIVTAATLTNRVTGDTRTITCTADPDEHYREHHGESCAIHEPGDEVTS